MPPKGAGLSLAAFIFPITLRLIALRNDPFVPDILHTAESFLHPVQLYLHSILLTKNDCPNRASSLNVGTASISLSMSVPSHVPLNQISIPSAVPSLSDAHDLPEHSSPLLLLLHIRISHVCSHLLPLRSALLILDIDISAPIQCDTDNAISYVIIYETCSLPSPSSRCCGYNSRLEIAVSGPSAKPIRGRLSLPHITTSKGRGFLLLSK